MNSPAIMQTLPVKLGILVQFLIFFGIIASTVTITRSVVQGSLLRINANLEQFQKSGGAPQASECGASECGDQPKASIEDGETSDIMDYSQLQGYIVSNKEQRYNNSKLVLDKLGICSHHYIPLSYKSEAISKAMLAYHEGSTIYHTDTYKKVFSNRMAFTDLFQKFIDDKRADIKSWRFFFEDDVQLHPVLLRNKTLAQTILARGMEVAAGDGIMYLGICGPRRCQDKTMLLGTFEASRCAGACTHAFALTKWKTGGFLAYMDKLKTPNNPNITSMYMDQLMRTYGDQVHKIWVIGSNLKSPQMHNHFGLVYQDRRKFPSIINNKVQESKP